MNQKQLTYNQAKYQAQRAREVEYNRKMLHPNSPGRNRDRQDSANLSAEMAYEAKLREWGYEVGE